MIIKHKITKDNIFNVYKFIEDIFKDREYDIKLIIKNTSEIKKQTTTLSDDQLSALVDNTLKFLMEKIFISICLLVTDKENLKLLNNVDFYKDNKNVVDDFISIYSKETKKKSSIILPK